MDPEVTKQREQAKKAEKRWRRRLGITLEMVAKLNELPYFRIPRAETLLREEEEERAYRKLQKGRPTRQFLARLEEALHSDDSYEQAAALRTWKDMNIPFKQGLGRTKKIADREKIKDEARRRIAAGEKKDDVIEAIAERTRTKPSYILRMLQDRRSER